MRTYLVCATLGLISMTACGGGGDDGGTPPPPTRVAKSVTLTASSSAAMTSLGDTRTITAVVKDSSDQVMSNAAVNWSSNASSIVSVSPSSGLTTTATAVANGNAIITATSGPATATTSTSVQQELSSVQVTPGSFGLTVGGTRQLSATAKDARGNVIAGVSGYNYSSNNTGVATVNGTGNVTGAGIGTAVITASVTRNSVTSSGTSTVTVGTTSLPTTATVSTDAGSFNPATVEIAAGGTVTWQFGPVAHNVNFATAAITNIGTTSNASVSRTFPTAGTYGYHCNIHEGMTGTVTVQ